jgi:hypothetical protein
MILKKKSELKIRLSLIIAAVAFIFTGIDSLDQNNLTLAASNFLLAAVNLGGFYFIKLHSVLLNTVLLIFNSFLAFIIAYNYFIAGKIALPLAWLLLGILYLIVAVKNYRKQKLNTGI